MPNSPEKQSKDPSTQPLRDYDAAVKEIQGQLMPKLNAEKLTFGGETYSLTSEQAKKKHDEIVAVIRDSLQARSAKRGTILSAEHYDTDETVGLSPAEFANFALNVNEYIKKKFLSPELNSLALGSIEAKKGELLGYIGKNANYKLNSGYWRIINQDIAQILGRPLSPMDRSDLIRFGKEVQSLINEKGEKIEIDGMIGPKTLRALAKALGADKTLIDKISFKSEASNPKLETRTGEASLREYEILQGKITLTPQQVAEGLDASENAKRTEEWARYQRENAPQTTEANKEAKDAMGSFCDNLIMPIETQLSATGNRIKELREIGFFAFTGPSNLFGLVKDDKGRTPFETELDELVEFQDKEKQTLAQLKQFRAKLAEGKIDFSDLGKFKAELGKPLSDSTTGKLVLGYLESSLDTNPQKRQYLMFYNYYLEKGAAYKSLQGDYAVGTADTFFGQAKKIAEENLNDPQLAAQASQRLSGKFETFRRDYLARYAEPFVQYDSLILMAAGGPIGNALSKSAKLAKLGVMAESVLSKSPALAKLTKILPGVEIIGSEAMLFGKKVPTVIRFIPNFGIEMGKFMAYEAAAEKIGGKDFGKAVSYACMLLPGLKSGFEAGLKSRADYAKLIGEFSPQQLESQIALQLENKVVGALPAGEKIGAQDQMEIREMAKGIVSGLKPEGLPLLTPQIERLSRLAEFLKKGQEVIIDGTKYIIEQVRKGATGAYEFIVRDIRTTVTKTISEFKKLEFIITEPIRVVKEAGGRIKAKIKGQASAKPSNAGKAKMGNEPAPVGGAAKKAKNESVGKEPDNGGKDGKKAPVDDGVGKPKKEDATNKAKAETSKRGFEYEMPLEELDPSKLSINDILYVETKSGSIYQFQVTEKRGGMILVKCIFGPAKRIGAEGAIASPIRQWESLMVVGEKGMETSSLTRMEVLKKPRVETDLGGARKRMWDEGKERAKSRQGQREAERKAEAAKRGYEYDMPLQELNPSKLSVNDILYVKTESGSIYQFKVTKIDGDRTLVECITGSKTFLGKQGYLGTESIRLGDPLKFGEGKTSALRQLEVRKTSGHGQSAWENSPKAKAERSGSAYQAPAVESIPTVKNFEEALFENGKLKTIEKLVSEGNAGTLEKVLELMQESSIRRLNPNSQEMIVGLAKKILGITKELTKITEAELGSNVRKARILYHPDTFKNGSAEQGFASSMSKLIGSAQKIIEKRLPRAGVAKAA